MTARSGPGPAGGLPWGGTAAVGLALASVIRDGRAVAAVAVGAGDADELDVGAAIGGVGGAVGTGVGGTGVGGTGVGGTGVGVIACTVMVAFIWK